MLKKPLILSFVLHDSSKKRNSKNKNKKMQWFCREKKIEAKRKRRSSSKKADEWIKRLAEDTAERDDEEFVPRKPQKRKR